MCETETRTRTSVRPRRRALRRRARTGSNHGAHRIHQEDDRGASLADAGEVLARQVIALSRAVAIPNGITGVGYAAADIPDLVSGTLPQQRLLANAPCEVDGECLRALFDNALSYW